MWRAAGSTALHTMSAKLAAAMTHDHALRVGSGTEARSPSAGSGPARSGAHLAGGDATARRALRRALRRATLGARRRVARVAMQARGMLPVPTRSRRTGL